MHANKCQSNISTIHSSSRSSRLNLGNGNSTTTACFAKKPICGKLSILHRRRSCSSNRQAKALGSVAATPFSTLVTALVWRSTVKRKAACGLLITALFEKFTEQAIKGIMGSQREAKALGADEVGQAASSTCHLLQEELWVTCLHFRSTLNTSCLVSCRSINQACSAKSLLKQPEGKSRAR